jgi:hypothetical protein
MLNPAFPGKNFPKIHGSGMIMAQPRAASFNSQKTISHEIIQPRPTGPDHRTEYAIDQRANE